MQGVPKSSPRFNFLTCRFFFFFEFEFEFGVNVEGFKGFN